MRLHPSSLRAGALLALALALPGCMPARRPTLQTPGTTGPVSAFIAPHTEIEDVREELMVLADDSMQGRLTGTPGMVRAARYLARRFADFDLLPAGEDPYFQYVPLAWTTEGGRRGLQLLNAWSDTVPLPPARRARGINVVGVIPGRDPELAQQVVLIDAHYDHLGTADQGFCRAVAGDAICNGADDDASGVVAVLEIAREFQRGPLPKRTVVFLLTTGEELGLLGTRWYIAHPVQPLERMVANLEIEMIGRPDSLAGGGGKAWLTGYDRSTMGDMLSAAGIEIVADPRPGEHFFERSDNIAFAMRGIPAHTLSSFNLHGDYHTPRDEASRVDYGHMTAVIRAAVRAARILADGPAPVWKPGGRPDPNSR